MLLPRALFAQYDADSSSPRNRCTKNTRKPILDNLRVWASDNTAQKVYCLNGMAGTGKTTIAYSFSQILDEAKSLNFRIQPYDHLSAIWISLSSLTIRISLSWSLLLPIS